MKSGPKREPRTKGTTSVRGDCVSTVKQYKHRVIKSYINIFFIQKKGN